MGRRKMAPDRPCVQRPGKRNIPYLRSAARSNEIDSRRRRATRRFATSVSADDQLIAPQPAREHLGGEDVDAVLRPPRPGLQADQDAASDLRELAPELAEALQMVRMHPRRTLGLDGAS